MTTSLLAPISPKFSNIQKAVNNIRKKWSVATLFFDYFLHQLHKIAFNIDKCFKKILKGSIYIYKGILFVHNIFMGEKWLQNWQHSSNISRNSQ